MALQEAHIPIVFAGGIDTKTDRKGVLPTKLLALENAVFDKERSLVKSFGFAALTTAIAGGGAVAAAKALGVRGDELLRFSEDEAHSYIDDSTWVKAGDIVSVITSHERIAKTGSNQTAAEYAVLSGVGICCWEDSRGGSYYTLMDDASKRTIVAPTQIAATATTPRVAAVGPFLHLYWVLPAAKEIWCWRFDPNEPTLTPDKLLLVDTLSIAQPFYDIDTDDTKAALAWIRDPGGDVGVAYVHHSGVLGNGANGLAAPVVFAISAKNCIAVAIDKTQTAGSRGVVVAVGYDTDPADRYAYQTYSESLVASGSVAVPGSGDEATRITCCYARDSDSAGARNVWIVYERAAASPSNVLLTFDRMKANPGSATFQERNEQRGQCLATKAFVDGSDVYVHSLRDTTFYRTYFCQRTDKLVVARLPFGLAQGRPAKGQLPMVNADAADARMHRVAVIDVQELESPDVEAVGIFAEKGIRLLSLDFDAEESHRSGQLGDTLYIAGGHPQAYDGERVVEAGFHYAIDDVAAPTQGTPTGSGIAPGTRNYKFTLEWTSARGEIDRGPVSVPVVVTIPDGANKKVTFTIPTLRLTAKPNVRIGAWRTIDGDTSVYQRVSSLDPTATGANGYIANDPTVDTVTFIDEMPDTTLETQQPLYTNGGIPTNRPSPAARFITQGKGRLFYVDAAQPQRVYYSQEREADHMAELSPALFVECEPYGGEISGIAVLDDRLIIFKETAIFFVSGSGPGPNPLTGQGFGAPQQIPSDVGCQNADSIAVGPEGVYFQTEKGRYLLDRGLNARYIGAPVEAYNSQRDVAATVFPDRREIRWVTASGVSLIYDYGIDQWSTRPNHLGKDAALVNGAYHYLRTDDRVFRETRGAYKDDNSQIRMAIETAWIKLAGYMQGWQQLWWVQLLGEWKSTHLLRMKLAFDYVDDWVQSIDLDPDESRVDAPFGEGPFGAGPFGGSVDTRYQFQIHVGTECEAVRFRFEDVEPLGSFGASFEISELLLVGGIKRTHFQMEEARSY